jgi:hypothetical protein
MPRVRFHRTELSRPSDAWALKKPNILTDTGIERISVLLREKTVWQTKTIRQSVQWSKFFRPHADTYDFS